MNVDEGLEELRVNLLKDDADLASGPDDRLWSDAALVRYWNEGIRQFARRALVLRDDSTPEVCEVRLRTGQTKYTLHPSVRAVVSARYHDSDLDLVRVGHSLLSAPRPSAESLWFDTNQRDTWNPGPALAFSTDETLGLELDAAVVLRIWPAPSATENGYIVRLRVARVPLADITLADLGQVPPVLPELPTDYHLDSLEWAAYRAFRNDDRDGASDKASSHRTRFDEAVRDALKDVRRKMFAPTTWAFGRGGFAWSE